MSSSIVICERGFSKQNAIKSHLRNSLNLKALEGGSLNTPDERCTCQVRMPGLVGFIFLALPILAPWGLFGFFWAKFGFYGPKLL